MWFLKLLHILVVRILYSNKCILICFNKMKKENIIGWALTVLLSVAGAWYAIDSRVYAVEKKIELLQMQIDNSNKVLDKQQRDMEDVKEMFNRIDKNIVEIRGVLNTKADKSYR